jgi:hypothetical protein
VAVAVQLLRCSLVVLVVRVAVAVSKVVQGVQQPQVKATTVGQRPQEQQPVRLLLAVVVVQVAPAATESRPVKPVTVEQAQHQASQARRLLALAVAAVHQVLTAPQVPVDQVSAATAANVALAARPQESLTPVRVAAVQAPMV